MRLYISSKRKQRAFTRPQWLFIILLAVVAFEMGARLGQKKPDLPTSAPARKTLNVAMPHQPLLEAELKPTDGEPPANPVETNGPEVLSEPETRQTVSKPPASKILPAAGPGDSGPRVISEPSSPQYHKVKVPLRRRYPVIVNGLFENEPPPGGVRVSIP